MKIETLAKKARSDIGPFCHEECGSYCCRKGYLVMTRVEVDAMSNNRTEEFLKSGIIKMVNGKYSYHLSANQCPSLKPDLMCSIHKNKNRPLACKEFPVFIEDKEVRLAHRCLAVKQGKLYPFQKQAMALGYKVVISDPLFDDEFYQAPI